MEYRYARSDFSINAIRNVIHRKIENFLDDDIDRVFNACPPCGVLLLLFVILPLLPVWLPIWLVGRFWNTPSE